MPTKFDEPNYDYDDGENRGVYQVPSYQMPTISSRLKIVDRGDELNHDGNNEIAPFAVGATFVTHNVKLLKQETIKKLKLFLHSYRNENEINAQNINDLRLLKYDIDRFRTESQKLKCFVVRRKKTFLNLPMSSRYGQTRIHEKTFRLPWRAPSYQELQSKKRSNLHRHEKADHELASLFQLQNQLKTIFKHNDSGMFSDGKEDGGDTKIRTEAENPVEEQFQKQVMGNDNQHLPAKRNSALSINGGNSCSSRYSSVKDKRKRKKRYVSQMPDTEREIYENEENCNLTFADLKEKFRLPNEGPMLNLSPGLTNIQPSESRRMNLGTSIYSKRKKRRHVRYVKEEPKYPIAECENEAPFVHRLSEGESDEESVSTIMRNRNKQSDERSIVDERPISQKTVD